MGNPEFSVAGLKALADSSHIILTVVTNPPKPQGRGRALHPTPVARAAEDLHIPVIPLHDLRDPAFHDSLQRLNPDLFVVVAFRILPSALIELPGRGCINLHTSLLPKYRGAAPIQRALMNGDRETGLTTFLIQPRVDSGDILLQKPIPIRDSDDFGTLSERLSRLGADLLVETVNRLEKGDIVPQAQDNSQATPAPKIRPDDCQIHWDQPARVIHNQIRALSPRPGAFTFWRKYRLKVFQTCPNEQDFGLPAGHIIIKNDRVLVQTGSGSLELLALQREGKKRVSALEFIRGYALKSGDLLG